MSTVDDELVLSERIRFRKLTDPVRVQAERQLRHEYETGLGIRRLSERHGLSYWLVRQALLRAGATLRPVGDIPGRPKGETTTCQPKEVRRMGS